MKRVLAMLQSCMLVVLMAATGEGGEFIINDEGAQPMIEWSHETHALKPVSVDPKELKVNYYEKFTIPAICIERMREAMRLFNRYIVNPLEYRLPGPKQSIYQMPNESEVAEWKDTMEACVK